MAVKGRTVGFGSLCERAIVSFVHALILWYNVFIDEKKAVTV